MSLSRRALPLAALAVAGTACVVYVPKYPPPGSPPRAGAAPRAQSPAPPAGQAPAPRPPPPPPPANTPAPADPAPARREPTRATSAADLEELRVAATAGDLPALDALRRRGVDLSAPADVDGNSALAYAVLAGQARAAELLLGFGASPNGTVGGTLLKERSGEREPIPFVTAAERLGSVKVLEQLLRYGAMVLPMRSAEPLAGAVESCDAAMTELLVRFGAPVRPGFVARARQRGCSARMVDVLAMNDATSGAPFDTAWKGLQTVFREGANAYSRGDFRGSARIFEEGLTRPLFAPGLHRHAARAYEALHDEPRAAQHYARYLELANTSAFGIEIRQSLLKLRAAAPLANAAIPPPFMVRWWCGLNDPAECRRLCDLGHGGSCLVVAGLLEQGSGRAGDDPRALPFLERSCELGTPDACYAAAVSYLEGVRGARRDAVRGEEYARRSCTVASLKPGCSVVANVLADRVRALPPTTRPERVKEAAAEVLSFVKSGCVQNEEQAACVALGKYYFDGVFVPRDPQLGFRLMTDACDNGWGGGCKEAAAALSDGRMPRDPDLAEAYRMKGCKAGEKSLCR